MVMTQQYLIGELLLLLSQMRAELTCPDSRNALAGLTAEAETMPPWDLGPIAVRALQIADKACWDSLTVGDTDAFSRQARVAVALYDFGACSGLLGGRRVNPSTSS
jgi:hypothetical protein